MRDAFKGESARKQKSEEPNKEKSIDAIPSLDGICDCNKYKEAGCQRQFGASREVMAPVEISCDVKHGKVLSQAFSKCQEGILFGKY